MKRRGRRSRISMGAAALAGVTALTLSLAGCGNSQGGIAAVGRPAPEVSGPTVTGPAVTTATWRNQYLGHWFVVNFFATWCEACKQETPQLVSFASQQAQTATKAQVIGVLYLDTSSKARSFATSHGVTWPIIDDDSGKIAARYGVNALPESFVIDPQGNVTERVFGGVTETGLDQALSAGGAKPQ